MSKNTKKKKHCLLDSYTISIYFYTYKLGLNFSELIVEY